jgi:carbon storage regulator CsrA
MLVLSRRIGERICIEPGIEIAVLAVHGRRVELGICAPRDVLISRPEQGEFGTGYQSREVETESVC